jgi:hypothetical protein
MVISSCIVRILVEHLLLLLLLLLLPLSPVPPLLAGKDLPAAREPVAVRVVPRGPQQSAEQGIAQRRREPIEDEPHSERLRRARRLDEGRLHHDAAEHHDVPLRRGRRR